jgi:hypothetical protein
MIHLGCEDDLFLTFTTAFVQVMIMTISPLPSEVWEYMSLLSVEQFIAELKGGLIVTVNGLFFVY